MTEATQRTSDNGVSIWLDDLSRTRIESGSLQEPHQPTRTSSV